MLPRATLIVERLVAGYEPGNRIVDAVSMTVSAGQIVAVLGPNGAGKSTLAKAIAGLVPVESGRVLLAGTDITRRAPHALVRAGLAFVPQTENVFATLTVDDNLQLAVAILARGRRAPRLADAYALFPDLHPQRHQLAGALSGGQRQMLALARALISSPTMLVLDEPSAGLAPKMVTQVIAKLREIRSSGVGVLLIEQNVRAALAVADRVYVLAEGRNRLDGDAGSLAADPTLATLYLGSATAAAQRAVAR